MYIISKRKGTVLWLGTRINNESGRKKGSMNVRARVYMYMCVGIYVCVNIAYDITQ